MKTIQKVKSNHSPPQFAKTPHLHRVGLCSGQPRWKGSLAAPKRTYQLSKNVKSIGFSSNACLPNKSLLFPNQLVHRPPTHILSLFGQQGLCSKKILSDQIKNEQEKKLEEKIIPKFLSVIQHKLASQQEKYLGGQLKADSKLLRVEKTSPFTLKKELIDLCTDFGSTPLDCFQKYSPNAFPTGTWYLKFESPQTALDIQKQIIARKVCIGWNPLVVSQPTGEELLGKKRQIGIKGEELDDFIFEEARKWDRITLDGKGGKCIYASGIPYEYTKPDISRFFNVAASKVFVFQKTPGSPISALITYDSVEDAHITFLEKQNEFMGSKVLTLMWLQ